MKALKFYPTYFLIFTLCFFMSETLFSANTGKVAGVVVNEETGEPIIGANIIISERWVDGEPEQMRYPLGAASNENGEYYILNVRPGEYSVSASVIGFAQVKKTRVKVLVDRTTRVDFDLTPEAIAGQEVIVTGYKRDAVEIDQTATKQTYLVSESRDIAGVDDIADILELQADVVDNHFRGGREGESQYLVANASINNPLNSERSFSPMVSALEQVEVYTSGFSAEYGNAQSGVINMVIREGGDEWNTEFDVRSVLPGYQNWGGNLYDPANHPFFQLLNDPEEWLEESPEEDSEGSMFDYANYDKLLPVWGPTYEDSLEAGRMSRLLWLQYVRDMGMEYEHQRNYRFDFNTGGPISQKSRLFLAGRQEVNRTIVPTPHPDVDRQLIGNIATDINANNKARLILIHSRGFQNHLSDGSWDDWMFDRVFPVSKRTSNSTQLGLEWNHVINQQSYFNIRTHSLRTYEDEYPEYLDPGRFRNNASNDGLVGQQNWPGGIGKTNSLELDRGYQRTLTTAFSGSYSNQINTKNLLKTGFQFSYYDLDVEIEDGAKSQGEMYTQRFSVYPYEGALYVQDKMEYEGLVANLGLRFDFYNFNHVFYADEYAPLRNPDYNPDLPYAERGPYYSRELADKDTTQLHTWLQPRLGLAFPITESSVIHLNYGTFLQRPSFNRVLYNEIDGYNRIAELGNPRLRPEKTVSYDIGVVQGLPMGFLLDVSAYYKDVKDLVERALYKDELQNLYATYVNRDYANIKGFHVNIEKSGDYFRTYVRYNWQVATGKSSNPFNAPVEFNELDPQTGGATVILPDPEDIFLDYDRRHRLILNFRIFSDNKFGPEIFSMHLLGDWSLSTTYRYQTGRPYTWNEEGLALKHNKRTPENHEMKMKVQKGFRIQDTKLKVYVEGFNLLNYKEYDYDVFTDTEEVVRWEAGERDDLAYFVEQEPYLSYRPTAVYGNQPRSFRVGMSVEF